MSRLTFIIAISCLLIGFTALSQASDISAPQSPALQQISRLLEKIIPDRTVDNIEESAINGLYEVRYGTEIFYLSETGEFLIQGDMINLATRDNLTEIKRASGREALLKTISNDNMIIFSPDDKKPAPNNAEQDNNSTKHTVTVFTDIDCDYCRKMHREIKDYTDLGIEIRYLFYPRSGPNTRSYYKAIAVWCADDRKAALTKAKSGTQIDIKSCKNPIDQHMILADKVGVTGTPTLLLKDGSTLPGYIPAKDLLHYLDSIAAK